jgi:hypothetical protein
MTILSHYFMRPVGQKRAKKQIQTKNNNFQVAVNNTNGQSGLVGSSETIRGEG